MFLLSHEPPQRLPSLYWRSQARLPTGHPLWPARRGTCPVQVLEAQEISGNSQRVGPPGQSMMRTGQAACQRYREVSGSAEGSTGLTVRGGKARAVATDARFGEVRLYHSSYEAAEQSWAAGCGGGGAKGRDQGKRGPAKHVPDSEPEARDPGAEPRTANYWFAVKHPR